MDHFIYRYKTSLHSMLDNKRGKVVMVFQLYVLINPWFRNLETDETDQDYRPIK